METELDATPSGARALRALSLIAVSVLVLVGTGIAYLHPSLSVFTAAGTSPAVLQSAYSVSAVDFIDSKTRPVHQVLRHDRRRLRHAGGQPGALSHL